MKRITVNALVNIGCIISFIPMLATGIVLFFIRQSRMGGPGTGWNTVMGLTRNDWVLYHEITSFAFAALLIIHLLMHGNFFRNIGKNLKPEG